MNSKRQELTDEELEQVVGGFTIGGARITAVHPGEEGTAVTTPNIGQNGVPDTLEFYYDHFKGMPEEQIRSIPFGHPLYWYAQQYLQRKNRLGGKGGPGKGGLISM